MGHSCCHTHASPPSPAGTPWGYLLTGGAAAGKEKKVE